MNILKILVCFLFLFFNFSNIFADVRIKDVSKIDGVRENQLIGYGLVVGLAGTGDDTGNAKFTIQSIVSMLEHLGISINVDTTKVDNIAAVLVTAVLPAFAKEGTKIDVLLSSIGDCKSLKGGTLVMTPLMGPDKNIYAIAQGPVSIGGVGKEASHLTVARIPSGAIIEKEVPSIILKDNIISISLNLPDFTSSMRMALAINSKYKNIARAKDSATVEVKVPIEYIESNRVVEFISTIECLSIMPDSVSQIIINERSGTIVAGENIGISKVAIAHGNLSITIKNSISANDIEKTAGAENNTNVASEEKASVMVMKDSIKVGEVARALNMLGVLPKDVISILQAIRESGALQAEIKII